MESSLFPECLSLSSGGAVVRVVSLIVHHQLVVDEVETIRPRLERVLDHKLDCGSVKFGELVNVFARVLAVGDAEAEVKVEGLEVTVPEEVALYHPEVLDGLRADTELYGGAHGLKLQELKGNVGSVRWGSRMTGSG